MLVFKGWKMLLGLEVISIIDGYLGYCNVCKAMPQTTH